MAGFNGKGIYVIKRMIRDKLKKLKLNITASAEKYTENSPAITTYCKTCDLSLRAKDNEHRLILNTPEQISNVFIWQI